MVQPRRLILIGYWEGPEMDHSWPAPEDFVVVRWDEDERDLVASYLQTGLVARTYKGFPRCRMCGKENGDLELSRSKVLSVTNSGGVRSGPLEGLDLSWLRW